MIKKFILIGILFVLTLGAGAQFYNGHMYGGLSGSWHFPTTRYSMDSAGNIRFVPGDMGFSIEAGAGYTRLGGNDLFSTYTSPAVSYNVSDRLRLKSGVTLYNTFGQNSSPYPEYFPGLHPASGTQVFVSADYLLSNKIMLSGTVFKDFTQLNTAFTNDPLLNGKGYEGMIFNINYSPAKNVHINATIEYSNRPAFYQPNPFYHPSPFSPRFGW